MLTFEYILILLIAIFISNLINRFIPSVTVPIIQILLGASIAFLPLHYQPEFEPGLFFVLFIAPLIYNASMMIDKKSFWSLKGPILNMAFLLVFVSVIGFGYLLNWLVPAIPLMASFVLIAALAPTDDVAVLSVSKRTNVPPKIMNILSGESIINDASGIVSFQFAVAAVMTGSFSILQATEKFFLLAIGGILIGLLFTLLKYLLVKWIRSLGMENVTIHVLLEVLSPFLVYLLAERLEVSGILAVFTAGITYSFNRKKINPDNANLNIASNSMWNVLSFTLEGLVFLILGTQLPAILKSIQTNAYILSGWEILGCILLITFIFTLSRFIWSYFTIRKKTYDDPAYPVSKFKACLIFSLSGARGAVTLASAMSIPVLLNDGTAFPQRDMIILIAAGVILCTLFITNFILPLLVDKKKEVDHNEMENTAYLEILQNVVKELYNQVSEENKSARDILIREYYNRIRNLQNKKNTGSSWGEGMQELKTMIDGWIKENMVMLQEDGKIDEATAQHYMNIQNKISASGKKNKRTTLKVFRNLLAGFKHFKKTGTGKEKQEQWRSLFFEIKQSNDLSVLEKLKELPERKDNPLINKTISNYEFSLSLLKNTTGGYQNALSIQISEDRIEEMASFGFQIERNQIQAMFECGRISRETAKKMRDNISILETEMEYNPDLFPQDR